MPRARVVPVVAAVLAAALAAAVAPALAAGRCLAPGEPMYWRVDYCMLLMETDDEIAVSGCIEQEGRRRFRTACASNTHFKRRMCALMIRNGTRQGTLQQCVRDAGFQGRTVRLGGVGGP